jgi:hypothetical protein
MHNFSIHTTHNILRGGEDIAQGNEHARGYVIAAMLAAFYIN